MDATEGLVRALPAPPRLIPFPGREVAADDARRQPVGDLSRESLALIGYASLMFYYDAGMALLCMTGAPLAVSCRAPERVPGRGSRSAPPRTRAIR